ncbi:MAG TPA: hypothetical protein VD794_07035 [Flavisolibacter sp.]|nr:hypothetical protein [Flavisolibacter sp.]
MQKDLATILSENLEGLPFIDLLAGLAQTLTTVEPLESGATITHKRPVTYDHNRAEPYSGTELELIPNNTLYKSMIYFEDFGVTPLAPIQRMQGFSSRLRLICWMDRAQIVGDNYAPVASAAITAILDRLAGKNFENKGIFTRLKTEVGGMPISDAGLFNRYTYNENDRQYLRPPFEFFGIDLVSTFYISPKCLSQINWNNPAIC